ncbi:MAG TPA: hypothetical protein VGN59_14870 [Acidimicrobiia bacterium]|jgi:hypothetical protein
MDDASGPFDPDFDLEHLSRRTLAVLGREWLLHGHLQDRVGMPLVHEGRPREEMEAVAITEWMGASPVYSRRTQRALRFGAGDVPTIMKNLQLDIGAPHQFMDFRCRVDDANHGEFWLAHCGALMDVEPMGEDYVRGMCHTIEDPTFDATAVATNPRAQVRPVHRPPRVPADQMPHCRWTVEIDPAFEPVVAHPNVALVGAARIATIPVREPAGGAGAEPGGWDDYDRDFDPDFQLEDLSHRALVVALQEVAVQSHLLFRGFLLAVTQRFGESEAARINPMVFTGLAGLTAGRLQRAMGIDGDGAEAIAKVLQIHPMFFPRTYVDISVEVSGDDRVRFAILDAPAFAEGDDLHWFAQLGGAGDRALDAIVRAVNPRAGVAATTTRPGERFAYDAVIDPTAAPAAEAPEIGLARISTGAAVEFTPRRPVRAART